MIAYLNGRFVEPSDLRLTPYDSGFMLGITIAEQLRTFAGRPFRLDRHLQRLSKGVAAIGLVDRMPLDDLPQIIEHVVQHNTSEIATGDDLGVTVFVTPGIYPTYAPDDVPEPTIGVHTYLLPFRLWVRKYAEGQRLVVVDVQQISPKSWPTEIKCRSRMHYYLADRQAREIDPEATALLLDDNDCVSETPIANVILHLPHQGFVSPPKSRILPGVSLEFLQVLAKRRGIPFQFRDIPLSDFAQADEVLLSSTPYCLLPVSGVRAHGFNLPSPGPLFKALCQDWSRDVKRDFVAQATHFANR